MALKELKLVFKICDEIKEYLISSIVFQSLKYQIKSLLYSSNTCSESAWDKIFEINVKATFMLSKETLPYLRKRVGGSIIYISSIAGYQPIKHLGAYSVSKTALLGLTKAAAVDLASENIRVNCVAPGIIKTNFSSVLHESETAREAALTQIPMRRLGEPKEIGGVVAFLASEDASYITGESIIASGCMPSRL